MPRQSKKRAQFLCFFCSAVLLSCSGLHAQDNCNVEVKLLLLPAETQAAVAALGGMKETPRRIYFFDTDKLDLLSQGAIVRLRQGAKSDLTVKFRASTGKKLFAAREGGDDFKCEVDLTREGANSSYSITRQIASDELPQIGTDVSRFLSAVQIKLFEHAQVSVDWTRVKRIAEITSTDWQTQSQPRLGKLTLELWEWRGGRVLEVSTKVLPNEGSSSYTELEQLVRTKQLAMSPDQRAKTSIALEAIERATAH
ncbi:MAG: CYTH domain-containing protein [Candidatus Acidiferrales bacterium]